MNDFPSILSIFPDQSHKQFSGQYFDDLHKPEHVCPQHPGQVLQHLPGFIFRRKDIIQLGRPAHILCGA